MCLHLNICNSNLHIQRIFPKIDIVTIFIITILIERECKAKSAFHIILQPHEIIRHNNIIKLFNNQLLLIEIVAGIVKDDLLLLVRSHQAQQVALR